MFEQMSVAWVGIKRAVPADLRVRSRTAIFGLPALGRFWWAVDPQNRWNKISSDTQIVIDGYPRSANTYATNAFRLANPAVEQRALLHTPLAISEAQRRGIPAVLLVRRPQDAVASYMQMLPGLGARAAIRMYLRYYGAVRDHLDWCVVATFDHVTGDFGAVIRRCNEKFATTFAEYQPTPDNDRRVREIITAGWSAHFATPLPSSARRSSGEMLSGIGPAERSDLAAAGQLYGVIAAAAE